MCRSTQLVHMELPTSNKRTKHEIVAWPTGFTSYPDPGGMLDQSVTTLILFDRFLAGERSAVIKKVSK